MNNSPIAQQKRDLRKALRKKRDFFTPRDFEAWNQALRKSWLGYLQAYPPQGLLGIFYPRSFEGSPFFPLPKGWRYCFPKVKGQEIEFWEIENLEEFPVFFEKSSLGIWEPKEGMGKLLSKAQISALYLPLMAFDSTGMRLGNGGGFYDRFCEEYHGKKIGIAFDWQYLEEPIVRENHDILLEEIITPTKIWKIS